MCGLQNIPESKFCGKCGNELTDGVRLSPVRQPSRPTFKPKFLADKILATEDGLAGERKIATVLCADLADYGPMSEKMKPAEVYEVIDELFAILADQIVRYGGTISQVTRKGILALFGAQPAREDHAQGACRAALEIQKALRDYTQRVGKRFHVRLEIRVGLNSGPVLVGSIDDDLTGDYTEVGNTAGLAHEMQCLAKPGAIYVTEETFKRAEGFFMFEELTDIEFRLTPLREDVPPSLGRLVVDKLRCQGCQGTNTLCGQTKRIESTTGGLGCLHRGRLRGHFHCGRAWSGQIQDFA